MNGGATATARCGSISAVTATRAVPRITLKGVYGSDEFRASYAAALHGTIESDDTRPKIERPGNGTLAALIASYKQDAAFKGLRDTTKAGYLSRLDTIQREHGARSVAGLNQERIETMLAAYDDRPASKLDTLKKLRILIKHAMKKKWISGDPSTGIKRTKVGEVRSFTDDEIRQYENHWPIGTKQRTAFALMLYTGQRRSDVHRMIWQDISHKTGRIKVIQQKTGVKIQVPLHRDLLVVLEKARHNHVTIVNTEYGKPFTVDGFSSFMRDAIRAAGLPTRLSAAWTAQGRRSSLGGSRMHDEADHGGPWPQVACGSGAIHEGSRPNPARDGCDVAARRANRERSLPKPSVPVWANRRKDQEIQCDRDPAGAP